MTPETMFALSYPLGIAIRRRVGHRPWPAVGSAMEAMGVSGGDRQIQFACDRLRVIEAPRFTPVGVLFVT